MDTKEYLSVCCFFISLVFFTGCGKGKKELPPYKGQKPETIIRYDDRDIAKLKMGK